MDTTSLKLRDSYAECKADAARYVPTIGLYLPKERSDYLLLTPSISHEQTRTQHATSLLVGVHRFFVSFKDDTEKKNLHHPRHLRMKNARKFIVTHWKSVEAELSDDEFQLQVPIYRRILLLEKFVRKTREGLQLKSFSRLVIRLDFVPFGVILALSVSFPRPYALS